MPPVPVADLPAFLEGVWRVERDLDDGHRRGRFEGVATFSRAGHGLVWDERGEIAFGDHRGPARRRLLLLPHGTGWEVRFEDGRPFHLLDLSAGRCAAGHDCGADRYDGAFDVLAEDAFKVAWVVRGPRKDQRIVSRYSRA
jgi:hypothetical protein